MGKSIKIFSGIIVIAGLLLGGYYLFLDNVVKTALDNLESQNGEKSNFTYGKYKIDPFKGSVIVSDVLYKQLDTNAVAGAKTVMIALFEGKIGNGLIGRGLATEVSGYGPSYGKYTAPTLEFGNINLNNGKIGYLKSDKVNFAVDKEHSVLMIAEMKKMGGENTSSFWHKSLNELKPEDFKWFGRRSYL